MHLLGTILIDVIVVLFFVGLAGSAIVVLITFIEDVREFNAPEDAADEIRKSPPPLDSPPAKVATYTAPTSATGHAPNQRP